MQTITTEMIQSTNTFIKLGEFAKNGLNNKIAQQMLLKRKSVEDIKHCYTVWKNTGVIQTILSKYQLAVLQELIEKELKTA